MADLTSVDATALLDTGSTTSGVKREIASRLKLPELGKRPLGSAHGEAQVERFLFRIGFKIEGVPLPFVFGEISG
ncbi:MAG: aspartyl protease family protein [Allosphingosinicella sp.]